MNAVIRPPRAEYTRQDLGPENFLVRGRRCRRTDLQMRNPRQLALECSWWQRWGRRGPGTCPCVVYLHGNASCRLEARELVAKLLQLGIALFAFDFAGCGHSEGETITLGHHEKDDLGTVIDYLRASGRVSAIAVWGRSMGAVTALLHGHRDPSIAAMVLDSPFADFEQLARDIIDRLPLRPKPGVLLRGLLMLFRSSVYRRSGLDIQALRPIEHVRGCLIPAMFIAGKDDELIPPQHARDLHERYGGEKRLEIVEGEHSTPRPDEVLDAAAQFIKESVSARGGDIFAV